jgi:hypothetical protein
MFKLALPAAVKTAVLPLLTRKLFYGAAISCVVGIGLGVWLQPPKPHYGSATPVVIASQEQPNLWGDAAEASPAPANALPYAQASTDQTAAVSPPAQVQPADVQPVQLAQADPAQVAASGDTRSAGADSGPDGATPAAYTPPPPDRTQPRRRDAPGYDSTGRDNEDYLDDPPPARWDGPPPRGPGPGWDGPPPGGDPGDGDGG